MNLTKTFWEKAYKENAPKIIGICCRYVQNKEVAEDLMQDAFITAMSKSDTYTGKGSFEGWLRKIAVNTALMYLRNEKSKKIDDNLILNEHEYENMDKPNGSNIRTVIEQADFSDKELLEVIGCLPEHHRLVFNLYVIDNYTHIQISKQLNISVGTSKSHLARARKKIKLLLHQKAIDKTQDKKKRASLFFIFTCGPNYIDKLFKDKLYHFSIEPIKKSSLVFDSVKWNNVTLPKIKTSFFTARINHWLWGLPTGIGVVVLFSYILFNINLSMEPEINSNTDVKVDTIIQPIKKSMPAQIIEVDSTENKSNIELKKNDPIVIKKTIIQRKTITIRDTVKIQDSTNAK